MDLLSLYNPPEQAADKSAAVREGIIRESDNLKQPNFEHISTQDLARLFRLYDRTFFKGLLDEAAKRNSGQPLMFRLSWRGEAAGDHSHFAELDRRHAPR